MIVIECGDCRKRLRAPDDAAGKKVRCPSCKAAIPVPAIEMPEPEPPPYADEAGPRRRREEPAPAKKPSNVVLWVVLGVTGGLFVVCGGGAAALALIGWAVTRPIPAAEWRPFNNPGGGYTVSMPGTPLRKTDFPAGVRGEKFVLERHQNRLVFVIANLDLPAGPNVTLDALADAEAQALVQASKAKLVSQTDISTADPAGRPIPGKQIVLEAFDGSVVIERCYFQAWTAGGRLFLVSAGGVRSKVEGEDGGRFFDSFRVTEGAAPPAPPVVFNPPAPRPKAPPPRRGPREGELPRWDETGSDRTTGLAFSPDGVTLAVGHLDRRLRLWDVASSSDRNLLAGYTGSVIGVAFRRDGKQLAFGTGDGLVVRWDVAGEKEAGRFEALLERGKENSQVKSLAYSPDGASLTVGLEAPGGAGEVHVWDVEGTKPRAVLRKLPQPPLKLAYLPDGAVVVFLRDAVRVCEAATLKTRREFKGPDYPSRYVTAALSPDGKTVATAGADHKLRLWDVASGEVKLIWPLDPAPLGHSYPPMEFTPDGAAVVLVGSSAAVHALDLKTGRQGAWDVGTGGNVGLMAVSPDGKRLALHGNGGPKILEMDRVLATLKE